MGLQTEIPTGTVAPLFKPALIGKDIFFSIDFSLYRFML